MRRAARAPPRSLRLERHARPLLPRGQRALARAAVRHAAGLRAPARAAGAARLRGRDVPRRRARGARRQDGRGHLRRRLPVGARAGAADPRPASACRRRCSCPPTGRGADEPMRWPGIDQWMGGRVRARAAPAVVGAARGARRARMGDRLPHPVPSAPHHPGRRSARRGAARVARGVRAPHGAPVHDDWPIPTATTTRAWRPPPGGPGTRRRARCPRGCTPRSRWNGRGWASTTTTPSAATG